MDADELDWNRCASSGSSTGTISSEPGSTASPTTSTSGRRCRTPGACGRAAARRRPCRSVAGDFTIDYAFPQPVPRALHHDRLAARSRHRRRPRRAQRGALRRAGGLVRDLGVRRHARPAALDQLETQLDRLAGRGARPRRGRAPGPGRREGALPRGVRGRSGAAHPPRADPPPLRGLPAARPLPAHETATNGATR